MADAKSTIAFGRAAASFDVHESDFLVLGLDNVNTSEAMAFRFPTAADFDEYLKKQLRVRAAYRPDGGAATGFPRHPVESWETYRSSEDVGCLRKLWAYANQVAKRNMERMAGEDPESKSKVTVALGQELEDKAINSGMPSPMSDRDRPSLHTLTKVQNNFGPGGNFQHLPWETYVDMETESRLRRAGKLPKDKKEVVISDKKLTLNEKDEDFPETPKIVDILTLKDVLELRAKAWHMMEVVLHQDAMLYQEKLIGTLRATVPDGMRPPTINEARRCDREIMNEVLKVVAKGASSVGAGLRHYAELGDGEGLWKLLQAQPESFPDQGLEKGSQKKGPAGADPGRGRKRDLDDQSDKTTDDANKARLCMICKKRHEPRCEIPPGWRKAQKEQKKAEKSASAKSKSDPAKDKGGSGKKP